MSDCDCWIDDKTEVSVYISDPGSTGPAVSSVESLKKFLIIS
jgi:hypothetical protein